MSNLSNLIAAVDQVLADGETYNAIVHGPATGSESIVTTNNGPVKTLARAIAEFNDPILAVVLSALGIPSYANIAAANAVLNIGDIFFNTTTTKLQIATE